MNCAVALNNRGQAAEIRRDTHAAYWKTKGGLQIFLFRFGQARF